MADDVDLSGRTPSGWQMFGTKKAPEPQLQVRFVVDLLFPDNAVVKLSRTYDEVTALRSALLKANDRIINDRTQKAGSLPDSAAVTEDILDDVNDLLFLVETTEKWLHKIFTTIRLERCKCVQLSEFVSPRDTDCALMELELMARGGLGGTWGDQATVTRDSLEVRESEVEDAGGDWQAMRDSNKNLLADVN